MSNALVPTDEQSAIVAAAVGTLDSILISALAGAAKTTTLELIAKALPTTPILSLAFNKRIAEEMKSRLPGNVNAATLNSIGHRVWATATGRRLVVNSKKSYDILSETIASLSKSQKSDAFESFAPTLKAISMAKLNGYVPEGKFPTARRLISAGEFFSEWEWADEEPSDLQQMLVDEVLSQSIQAAYKGQVDFDDQIYMPTIFSGPFPKFPLVLVDEAQDLSPLNHAMLEKLVTKRIIAVGDRNQSIYGFRGAAVDSMDRLKSTFSMREMELSVSFRCPIEVVKLARERAPSMQWPEWASEGRVAFPVEWSPADIPDGAAIICRNNAPLFKLALQLIKRGRGVKLVGTDLGPSLVKALKKLGPLTMTRSQVYTAIDNWETERLKKSKAKASIADKADCLRVFASFGATLSESLAYAEHLFATSGPIQLLSAHKAKGLEWDTVLHLDPWRIPSKWANGEAELEQEKNIRYVITTRAKKELLHVNLEEFR